VDTSSLEGIASGLVASRVSGSLDVSLLKSVQNLDIIQAGVLFRSIGLGNSLDAYA
jgi:hypothetical protein